MYITPPCSSNPFLRTRVPRCKETSIITVHGYYKDLSLGGAMSVSVLTSLATLPNTYIYMRAYLSLLPDGLPHQISLKQVWQLHPPALYISRNNSSAKTAHQAREEVVCRKHDVLGAHEARHMGGILVDPGGQGLEFTCAARRGGEGAGRGGAGFHMSISGASCLRCRGRGWLLLPPVLQVCGFRFDVRMR